jgi:hypothetical protein
LISALPPKADITEHDHHVRFVPEAEVAIIRAMPVPPLGRNLPPIRCYKSN